ncbi:MAG: hypothetical protein MJE68_28025 [Proteobacteria bacterium]|nr:hypothetical protein [Pseudomonadota bacterium]
MEIVAHRGASGTHPENTMAAFTHASTLGVQWIETDVTLMGDGILLVHHDAHLGRVVAGEGRLADMTYPEVAGLDAGSWFGAEFADQRLLTLPKLLAWQATAGVGLNIEVKIHKQNHAALLASLTAALNTRDTREATATNPPPILVSSFDAEFLRLWLRACQKCHGRFVATIYPQTGKHGWMRVGLRRCISICFMPNLTRLQQFTRRGYGWHYSPLIPMAIWHRRRRGG